MTDLSNDSSSGPTLGNTVSQVLQTAQSVSGQIETVNDTIQSQKTAALEAQEAQETAAANASTTNAAGGEH